MPTTVSLPTRVAAALTTGLDLAGGVEGVREGVSNLVGFEVEMDDLLGAVVASLDNVKAAEPNLPDGNVVYDLFDEDALPQSVEEAQTILAPYGDRLVKQFGESIEVERPDEAAVRQTIEDDRKAREAEDVAFAAFIAMLAASLGEDEDAPAFEV